jgi:hypothetical protein
MRPRPQGGQGWRKGVDHHIKRGFLQSVNQTSGWVEMDENLKEIIPDTPRSFGGRGDVRWYQVNVQMKNIVKRRL